MIASQCVDYLCTKVLHETEGIRCIHTSPLIHTLIQHIDGRPVESLLLVARSTWTTNAVCHCYLKTAI